MVTLYFIPKFISKYCMFSTVCVMLFGKLESKRPVLSLNCEGRLNPFKVKFFVTNPI